MRVRNMRRSCAIAGFLLSGCFLYHGPEDAGGSVDGGGVDADASRHADGAAECPLLGGYRTCGALCSTPCDRSEGFGCQQYFDICVPFSAVTGCEVTLSAHDDEYPQRTYCINGAPCAVSSVLLDAARSVLGLCVREEYCQEVRMSSVDARCIWSDESEYVDVPLVRLMGPPEGLNFQPQGTT